MKAPSRICSVVLVFGETADTWGEEEEPAAQEISEKIQVLAHQGAATLAWVHVNCLNGMFSFPCPAVVMQGSKSCVYCMPQIQ